MSGGSYEYTCWRVEEEYVGAMHDFELDEMMKDLVKVLHDVEWWQSADIGEESYRKTVAEFKKKWFKTNRQEIIERIINEKCEKLKSDLEKMFLYKEDKND